MGGPFVNYTIQKDHRHVDSKTCRPRAGLEDSKTGNARRQGPVYCPRNVVPSWTSQQHIRDSQAWRPLSPITPSRKTIATWTRGSAASIPPVLYCRARRWARGGGVLTAGAREASTWVAQERRPPPLGPVDWWSGQTQRRPPLVWDSDVGATANATINGGYCLGGDRVGPAAGHPDAARLAAYRGAADARGSLGATSRNPASNTGGGTSNTQCPQAGQSRCTTFTARVAFGAAAMRAEGPPCYGPEMRESWCHPTLVGG
ncbi:hypothetical protein PLESTF_001130000 [Pleodorina starrii]|nr:hypothetical protein PLESTF_001130000 [Pleodorina starrii]